MRSSNIILEVTTFVLLLFQISGFYVFVSSHSGTVKHRNLDIQPDIIFLVYISEVPWSRTDFKVFIIFCHQFSFVSLYFQNSHFNLGLNIVRVENSLFTHQPLGLGFNYCKKVQRSKIQFSQRWWFFRYHLLNKYIPYLV